MRMERAWPNTTLVHLPVHASWLNQIEIYFSVLQRKAITPADFADLDHLAERSSPSKTATTPPPSPSTGATPAPTSTPSSPDSPPPDPRRTSSDDHWYADPERVPDAAARPAAQPARSATRSVIRARTASDTNGVTSPPSEATSRTRLYETYASSGDVGRNAVSTPVSLRFICAMASS